jgi:hypothetical protein
MLDGFLYKEVKVHLRYPFMAVFGCDILTKFGALDCVMSMSSTVQNLIRKRVCEPLIKSSFNKKWEVIDNYAQIDRLWSSLSCAKEVPGRASEITENEDFEQHPCSYVCSKITSCKNKSAIDPFPLIKESDLHDFKKILFENLWLKHQDVTDWFVESIYFDSLKKKVSELAAGFQALKPQFPKGSDINRFVKNICNYMWNFSIKRITKASRRVKNYDIRLDQHKINHYMHYNSDILSEWVGSQKFIE